MGLRPVRRCSARSHPLTGASVTFEEEYTQFNLGPVHNLQARTVNMVPPLFYRQSVLRVELFNNHVRCACT